jgi:hypothetical protein
MNPANPSKARQSISNQMDCCQIWSKIQEVSESLTILHAQSLPDMQFVRTPVRWPGKLQTTFSYVCMYSLTVLFDVTSEIEVCQKIH